MSSTNWKLDYAPTEDNSAVKGAQILGALFEGGKGAFQGAQQRRLYEALKQDENQDEPLPELVERGSAPSEGSPESGPRVQWQRNDLVPSSEQYFKRAKLRQMTGDTEGAKIDRAQAEKASIDSRDARKLNQKLLMENRAAKKGLQDTDRIYKGLQRIEQNMDKKYPSQSGSQKFWKRFGANLKLNDEGTGFNVVGKQFSTPEETLYLKNLNQLARGAKNSFGARVTNFELAQYMQQFPNLWQSPEARKALIDSLQVVNDLNLMHANLVEQGLAQTGLNANPAVFEYKIQEAMQPYIDAANEKLQGIIDEVSFPGGGEPPAELQGYEDVTFRDGHWYGKKGNQWYMAE